MKFTTVSTLVNASTDALLQMQTDNVSPNISSNAPETKAFGVLDLVYLTCEALIAVMIVVGNGLVLFAIASAQSLQTITNYFVSSLAAADLLVGLLGVPFVIAAFNGFPTNFPGCLFVNSLVIVLTQISIFGLLVVALERFFAIRYPYYYYRLFTVKRTAIAIFITWTSGIVVGMVSIFDWNDGKRIPYEPGSPCSFTRVIEMQYMVYVNFFGFVLPPLVAMFAIYGYIYTVVRSQMQKICALQRLSAAAVPAAAAGSGGASSSSQPPKTVSSGGGGRRTASADIQPGEFSVHENGFQRNRSASCAVAVTSSNRHSADDCRTIRESDNMNSEGIKEIKEMKAEQLTFVTNGDGSGQKSNNLTEEEEEGEEVRLRGCNSQSNESDKQRCELRSSAERESCSIEFCDRTMTRKNAAFTWKKEIRAAKWFAVVLTIFTVCWLPLHIMNCITVFSGRMLCADCVTFAALMSHVNSAVNPVLYAYSNSKFSAVFRRMLRLKVTQSSFRNRSSFLPTPTDAPKTRPAFR